MSSASAEIFGTLDIAAGYFRLKSDPYVRLKCLRLFNGVSDNGPLEPLRVKVTSASCEDIAWILDRWPHKCAAGVLPLLRAQVMANKDGRARSRRIMEGLDTLQINTRLPLRDYQAQAVALTMTNPGLLIGDTVGLGKTVTAIGIIVAHPLPALVVCPTHIQKQWAEKIKEFAPHLKTHQIRRGEEYDLPPHHVTIMSYGMLTPWVGRPQAQWHTVVYDEIHEFRGDNTKKGQSAEFLAQVCKVRIGLSGTPIFNYAGEIYNVFRALCPGALGTESEFKREWKSDNKGRVEDPVALGQWLRSQFIYIRRTREDVGRELPPEETINHPIEHDPKALDEIKALGRELAVKILQGTFTERGQSARELDSRLRQATGIAKAPFVAKFVAALVAGGEPVLLAGWHREVYDIWAAAFTAAGIRHAFYTGKESATQKSVNAAKLIDGEIDVLIMSLRSGEGLDGLQTICKTVVFGELDWSPARHHQLIGRVRRDGMDTASRVTAFFLIAKAGSDPIIAQILGNKWKSATAVTDPSKLNPDTEFTQEETESRIAILARDWLARTAA
jgi:superfamily II DNA or RNA helicase